MEHQVPKIDFFCPSHYYAWFDLLYTKCVEAQNFSDGDCEDFLRIVTNAVEDYQKELPLQRSIGPGPSYSLHTYGSSFKYSITAEDVSDIIIYEAPNYFDEDRPLMSPLFIQEIVRQLLRQLQDAQKNLIKPVDDISFTADDFSNVEDFIEVIKKQRTIFKPHFLKAVTDYFAKYEYLGHDRDLIVTPFKPEDTELVMTLVRQKWLVAKMINAQELLTQILLLRDGAPE